MPLTAVGSSSRRKGLRGEHEVAAIFRAQGFEVRGLEGSGDHLCIMAPRVPPLVSGHPSAHLDGLTIHSEVKRAETTKIWQWLAQLEAEAPPGTLPLLSFRRNRSPWYAVTPLEQLVRVLA
jgi:Holliday junction resolvase